MNTFSEPVTLGRSGLKVSRLGVSSSYGAPAAAFEEAFEKGCNYFAIGTFMKGRSREMIKAIRNITSNGNRDRLVVSIAEYTHSKFFGRIHFQKGLKKLGLDYADVLMLGYYPVVPRNAVLKLAIELKQAGMVRHVSLSGHTRSLFPRLQEDSLFDIFQLRYNAANRGAEEDVFPHIRTENRPGIIAFTATKWGQLLNPQKMPPGEKPLTAQECYRFVLSHPSVDICMTGTRSLDMMRENLKTLNQGPLDREEMERVRRIGDHIYGR